MCRAYVVPARLGQPRAAKTHAHAAGCILHREPVLLGSSIAFAIATTAHQSGRKSPRRFPEAEEHFTRPRSGTACHAQVTSVVQADCQVAYFSYPCALPLSTLNNNDIGVVRWRRLTAPEQNVTSASVSSGPLCGRTVKRRAVALRACDHDHDRIPKDRSSSVWNDRLQHMLSEISSSSANHGSDLP